MSMDTPTIFGAPFMSKDAAQHHAERYNGSVVEDGIGYLVVYNTHDDAKKSVEDRFSVNKLELGALVKSEDL